MKENSMKQPPPWYYENIYKSYIVEWKQQQNENSIDNPHIEINDMINFIISSDQSEEGAIIAAVTNFGNARLAKLHTATSSDDVNCTISAHKLLHWIVPRFC